MLDFVQKMSSQMYLEPGSGWAASGSSDPWKSRVPGSVKEITSGIQDHAHVWPTQWQFSFYRQTLCIDTSAAPAAPVQRNALRSTDQMDMVYIKRLLVQKSFSKHCFCHELQWREDYFFLSIVIKIVTLEDLLLTDC